jgi:hypothetical protein
VGNTVPVRVRPFAPRPPTAGPLDAASPGPRPRARRVRMLGACAPRRRCAPRRTLRPARPLTAAFGRLRRDGDVYVADQAITLAGAAGLSGHANGTLRSRKGWRSQATPSWSATPTRSSAPSRRAVTARSGTTRILPSASVDPGARYHGTATGTVVSTSQSFECLRPSAQTVS